MRRSLLSLTLVMLFGLDPRAQSTAGFTRYTRLEGLSNNYISGIVQDSLGYIWIATSKGLNRFDGHFFTSYYTGSPDLPLPGNTINQLKLQGQDLIGSTTGGAFSYNTATRRYTPLIVPVDSVLSFWANDIFETSRGGKGDFVVSGKTGLFAFDSAGKLIDRYDRYHPADAGRAEMLFGGSLYLPGDGAVLQENAAGFARYDPASNRIDTDYLAHNAALRQAVYDVHGHRRFTYVEHDNQLYLFDPERNALGIFRFRDNRMVSLPLPFDARWELDGRFPQIDVLNDTLLAVIGRTTGFYLLRLDWSARQLSLLGPKRLDSLQCNLVYRDRDGRLWVGTDDGLYKEDLSNPLFRDYDLAAQSPELKNTAIRAVYPDHDRLFLGLWDVGGILVLDKATMKIRQHILVDPRNPGANDIDFFLPYSADTLWFGTPAGLFWLDKRDGHTGRVPTPPALARLRSTNGLTCAEDHSGHIWLSFGGFNHIQRYDRATREFSEISNEQFPLLRITHCFSMHEDKDGNMWFAGDGFCRWNARRQTIDTLIPFPRGVPALRNFAFIMDVDSGDNLWLYSRDNGILRYNCHTGQLKLQEQENDLTDGEVLATTGIIRDTIWIAVENGMLAYNIEDHSVRMFPFGEGVPSFPLTSIARCLAYDPEGQCFYLASRRHLISFRPQLQVSPDRRPPLFLENISTARGALPVRDGRAELHYPDNSVTVAFNAINFSNPEGNRFAWKVNPSTDSGWHLLSEQRSVSFSDLSPGVYQVRVKLFSANNRWPEQYKDLVIEVYPPFWKSRWFATLAALAFLIATTLFYRYRLRRVRERLNLDKQVAEYEMKALHAQMNPHFIFNALNSIREMILHDDNRNASHYLSRFARLIRLNLEHSQQTFISLQQHIDYLEFYLEMEQLRFPDFSFRIDVSRDLDRDEVRLAPMLIQPLVENAIWHGLLPKESDKRVYIRFFRDAGQLVCEIEDNGIGIRQSLSNKTAGQPTHRSVGINNIKERIAVLNEKYRIRCSLVIRDKTDIPGQTDTGTLITLIFPAHQEQPIL